MCVGAEAEDCNLSSYTKVYVNGRIGEVLLLGRTSIKSSYNIIIDLQANAFI